MMDARLEALELALAQVPRQQLATLPTALEPAPRLANTLGVPNLLVKRDDLTGLAFGGNKVRALEYILAAALADGADVLVAGGGAAQSNHARLCAAAARRVGIHPVLVLRRDVADTAGSGNALITDLLGAEVHWFDDDPGLSDRLATTRRMDELADEFRRRGRRPYVLHSSLHPLGVLGYVKCAVELSEQLEQLGVERPVIVAASEGVVLTGLLLGNALLGRNWRVIGAGWRPQHVDVRPQLADLAAEAATLLAMSSPLTERDFTILDSGGPAYAVPSDGAWEAMATCLLTEGLLLDPVYTAKGMAALFDAIRAGHIRDEETPVFIHTGGLPALFADPDRMRTAVNQRRELGTHR